MLDAPVTIGALGAGALSACALLAAERESVGLDIGRWTARLRARASAVGNVAAARRHLAIEIERAGWRETPEHVVLAATTVSLCLGGLGAAISPAVAGFALFWGCFALALLRECP